MQLKSLEWLRPIQYLYQNDPLFSPVIPETPEEEWPQGRFPGDKNVSWNVWRKNEK